MKEIKTHKKVIKQFHISPSSPERPEHQSTGLHIHKTLLVNDNHRLHPSRNNP